MSGIKLKVLPQFPSLLIGRTGIAVSKTNGNYFLDLDYSRFPIVSSIPPGAIANTHVLVWNDQTQVFDLVPYQSGGGGGGGGGVTTIGGASGDIVLGNGLAIVGQTLSNNGVITLAGLGGAIAIDNTLTIESGPSLSTTSTALHVQHRGLVGGLSIPSKVTMIVIERYSASAPWAPAFYIRGGSGGTLAVADATGQNWMLCPGIDLDVRWFGCMVDGATDDSNAFASVMAASKATTQPIRLAVGTMVLTRGFLFDWNDVQIYGHSMRSSWISFQPTAANQIMFQFRIAGNAGGLFNGALKECTITTPSGVTLMKTAIGLYNTDAFTLENVNVQAWQGSNHPDVCVQLGGREFTRLKGCTLVGELPLEISQNPDRALVSNIDCDMLHVSDLWLIGNNNFPLIQIDPLVVATSIVFDGYQSWNLGAGGIVWNDTSPVAISTQISIQNVRHEQAPASAYTFQFNRGSAGLYNLHIQNTYTGMNGFYLRGVINATIINHAQQSTSGSSYGINADGASCRSISLLGCNWVGTGSGVLSSLTNFTYKGGAAIGALPVTGELWSTSNPPPA